MKTELKTIDEYNVTFPEDVVERMEQIREIVRKQAPEAVESISYGMPAFKLNGKPLVYYAGYKHHIGFYATPTGHTEFTEELSKYKQGKGSVQFPLDKPLPLDLIQRIVVFRVHEQLKKSKA
ncbi:MAG: hypothetical protein A3D31_07085 [Candidatus Fluviicola riflensis]|nr:MAG: hypothetical protein CHH17_07925 [Candidatus Fluviicola riflensis]OGS79715.1 MAG: hypothetical protein A3D31_07085 [Candidatus Fluviicola riflensis]OGS87148.1 MAG: hypothetical protein A2724_06545 [Fluviicola sp. RIFCSPHIGHO2_01_FULL_43_53]OGS89936.1 MAG: hypothetical protein A3E30_03290 [Fluviicola sp. RIFCSPHIGHO2_12_FULL_43_24]